MNARNEFKFVSNFAYDVLLISTYSIIFYPYAVVGRLSPAITMNSFSIFSNA